MVFVMYRALDMNEFTVGEGLVQDAHLRTESEATYAESPCVMNSALISVRTSETMFEMGGSVTVSVVSIKGRLLLMIGRARQAYSTSPRSAKVINKSMLSVALCKLAGLKDSVEFTDAIEIVVVAVLAPPFLRSILSDGLMSRPQRSATTMAAYKYRINLLPSPNASGADYDSM